MRKLVKMGHLPDVERVGCGDVKETTTAFEFSDEIEGAPDLVGGGTNTDGSSASGGASTEPLQTPDADEWEVSIDDI